MFVSVVGVVKSLGIVGTMGRLGRYGNTVRERISLLDGMPDVIVQFIPSVDHAYCPPPPPISHTDPFHATASPPPNVVEFNRDVHTSPSGDVATVVLGAPTPTNIVPFHAKLLHRGPAVVAGNPNTFDVVEFVHPLRPSSAVVHIIVGSVAALVTPPATHRVPVHTIVRTSVMIGDTLGVIDVHVIPSGDDAKTAFAVTGEPPANHVYPFHATVRPTLNTLFAEPDTGVHVIPSVEYAMDVVVPVPGYATATHRVPFHAISPTLGPNEFKTEPNGVCAGEFIDQLIPSFEYPN